MHLDFDDAVALAGFAAPAFHIERKPPGLVPAGAGFGQPGEPFSNGRESAGIGCRVGPRRSSDRRLIDIDDFIEMFQTFDTFMNAGLFARTVQLAGRGFVKRFDD